MVVVVAGFSRRRESYWIGQDWEEDERFSSGSLRGKLVPWGGASRWKFPLGCRQKQEWAGIVGNSQLPRGREEAIGGDRGQGEINPQEAGGRVSGGRRSRVSGVVQLSPGGGRVSAECARSLGCGSTPRGWRRGCRETRGPGRARWWRAWGRAGRPARRRCAAGAGRAARRCPRRRRR